MSSVDVAPTTLAEDLAHGSGPTSKEIISFEDWVNNDSEYKSFVVI